MTEKELLYIEDAIHHEVYMVETCMEVEDCLEEERLTKLVKKLKKKHEELLNMFMDILEKED